MDKKRILTGYRPTGKLHLGHWFGNMQNMLAMQDSYEAFYFVADWHALTTNWAEPENIARFTEEMVLDWCAAGIDPEKTTIYRQSDMPQVSELTLYLSMVTPMSWLERVPTYKEQKAQITDKDLGNLGFFQYPVLMTADITAMKADVVPVGEDQLPHLEIAREIVRRFNGAYGSYLVEPRSMINTEAARVPGLDGRKMSKSYGNAIFISDPPDEIRSKAMTCMTDPARKLKSDPGDPDVCPLHQMHKLVGSKEDIAQWDTCCRAAGCGCVAHKKAFAEDLIAYLAAFQEKRSELAATPHFAADVLAAGKARAEAIATDVIKTCRELMDLDARTSLSAGIEGGLGAPAVRDDSIER